MLYVLIGMAAVSGYFALRSPFPLFKLGASIPWIGLWAYIAQNYSGESWNVIAMLGCILMAVVFMLAGLGRDIKRSRTYYNNEKNRMDNEENHSFGWQLPEWMKGLSDEEQDYETYKKNMIERNNEYREKVHKAYHPHGEKRRR